MNHSETIQLSRLEHIDYNILQKKYSRKNNPPAINFEKLRSLLTVCREESLLFKGVDYSVTITFKVSLTKPRSSNNSTIAIRLFGSESLFPHISPNSNSLEFVFPIKTLQELSEQQIREQAFDFISNEHKNNFCSLDNDKLLKMTQKIDDLFNLNGESRSYIFKNGIYSFDQKANLSLFITTFNYSHFYFRTHYKTDFFKDDRSKEIRKNHFFNIHLATYDNYIVTFDMDYQKISLTYDQFMKCELSHLENILLGMLSLRDLPFSNIEELKTYLILQEMQSAS